MSEIAANAELVHGILNENFAERYIERSGISGVAYALPYDPRSPLCDYEQTWWEARPNRASGPVGRLILGKQHKMSGDDIDRDFVAPFAERTDDIARALKEFPVMLINGHSPDLQAALSLFSANSAVASEMPGRYQRNLRNMIRISHGIATRAMAPIIIGRPNMRPSLSFMRLQQLVVNPHLSFPMNDQMRSSGIPLRFVAEYNGLLKSQSIEAAKSKPDHPDDFWTFWSLAPGATPDIPGKGEHEGKMITRKVGKATCQLVADMGCGLLPVYTSFGYGKRPNAISVGAIIPPDQVRRATLPTAMADLAAWRRAHGEENVYYEEELAQAV